MKNNTFFKLFVIFIISFLFRIWFLDKEEGLWNDEYVSWFIASRDTFSEFFNAFWSNCHTPFYYFYLKFWLFIFPDTDISLRWSSVIPSVFSVYTMFLLGKEFKSKSFGILLAFFTAVSSFSIYFAQEVRFYSLLFLFTTLAYLYFLKTIKNPISKNFIIFFLINALVCLTHTLGIIFSFFLILFLFVYLFKNFDEFKKFSVKIIDIIKYISPFLVVVLLLMPFLINLYFSNNLSQFWSRFSLAKLYFNFSDYFSPMQINIINSPDSFFKYLFDNSGRLNYKFLIFSVIPVCISLIFTISAFFQKNKFIKYLSFSVGSFFFVMIILSLLGKIVLSTKYSVEIYPLLILLFVYGFSQFKYKKVASVLFVLFFILNFYYLILSNESAPKLPRPEGNKAVVALLKHSSLKNTDRVVLTYYDVDKFQRYLDDDSHYRFFSINKFNFNYSVFNNDNYVDVLKHGKFKYRNLFLTLPNKNLLQYYTSNFTYGMKKGDKIGIIFLDSVSFLTQRKIEKIVNDDELYNKTSLIFLVFSSIKNNFISIMSHQFKLYSVTQLGHWTLFVYEKK